MTSGGAGREEPTCGAGHTGSRTSFDVESSFQQAVALHQQSRLAEAREGYVRVLEIAPQHDRALNLLGVIALETQQPALAVELISKSVALEPRNFGAHVNLGNALCTLGRFETALESYERAAALNPHAAQIYNNQGNALRELQRYDAALTSYDRAISLDPRYAEAHLNRAMVLANLGRPMDALRSYDATLSLDPRSFAAWVGRGDAQSSLRRYVAAAGSYQRAIALQPNRADTYNNLAIALAESGQAAAAVSCYDRAIALAPDNPHFHNNRGNVLHGLKQHEAAARSYGAAYRLGPELPGVLGVLLHTRMQLCEWEGLEAGLADLSVRTDRGQHGSNPLFVLALSDSAALQRGAAQIVAAKHSRTATAAPPIERDAVGTRKIRVGYFSADFHAHATAYLMAELLELHDRSRFEISAFSFGPESQDEMRQRITAACTRFVDVRSQSDAEVAQLSRSLGLDIAIDLKGFTRGGRLGIFAHRAAPIQVSYLGYPGTLGASFIDYLIADRTLIPPESQGHYTEKIIYLPDSYQVNDSKRRIAEQVLPREAYDLPQAAFVFCCFNNTYKITPWVFAVWMRILQRVPGSVLWLFEGSPEAVQNLRREADRSGIDSQRLIFAKHAPLADHLARYSRADLFLDTLPCNAHTTASDALWAGLPVLTCTGEAFASRVAASLLRAVGLPELVASNLSEYEERAVSLAAASGSGSAELGELRQRLSRNRLSAPLFDTERFRRHLEAAFVAVCDRYRAGQPPEHIHIAGG